LESSWIVDWTAYQYVAVAWIAGLAIFLQMVYWAPEMTYLD
jgi:hypothetical protein